MSTTGTDLPGEISSGGGSYDVEMAADGSFEVTRDEWRYLIESPQGTLVAQIDGTESGTYEADGNTLTAAPPCPWGCWSAASSRTCRSAWRWISRPTPFGDSAHYECTDETLTVSSETEGPSGETLVFESVFLRR